MQGPAPIMGENDADDERSVESYNMLMEVLQASNIEDDEEAVMVTRMAVDPRHVKEFERILRLILKNTHTVGHVSTCVVKPARGEYTYTSIVKYASLSAMRQIFPSSENGGLDFYKLFAARDSLLVEPPTYQIEAGFGTWIESDGNTRPMRDDNDDNMVYNTIPKPCCDDSCDNPHGLNVRASFIAPTKNFQLFQPRYQRNNKKGGQKNLRCFPCCRNGRHVSSGFCGDSIRVHVAVSRITESGGIKICPISSTAPAVLAYARFLNLEGAFDPMVSGPEVFPGQTIEKYELSQYVRDKDHPLNPLFPGILRGAAMESTLQSATFEFNAECKAWHYGWTAPRGQGLSGSDAQHVLEILFLKPMGSYLFCLERLRSDTFSIYSSRRASHATVKPEAEVYENDEEVEDERGQKRKRAMAPASPAPSTMSSYSSGSASATSSPHAGNHHQYHPHVHGQSQTHASAWSVLNRPSPSHKTSNVGTAQLQHAMEEVTFKVEPMPPLSQSPSSRHDHHHHGHSHSHNHGHAHHQRPHQQRPMFVGENLDMLFQPPAPQSTMNHGYHHQNSAMGDTHMLPESGDLVDHMLFADDQHERRVVSSEELPWAELYNLFDNVPMNSPSAASDDASSNNDMDDESPVSSPTPSSDSATCTTSSAGAAAILTYL